MPVMRHVYARGSEYMEVLVRAVAANLCIPRTDGRFVGERSDLVNRVKGTLDYAQSSARSISPEWGFS